MKCFYPVNNRPCGQCAACLVNKSLAWKFRLEQEVLVSDLALWLTLQYDEQHLPRSNGIPVVSRKHCVNYLHKLRRYIKVCDLKVTLKYFLVSEYGPLTLRPHYHVLFLFRLPQKTLDELLELRQILYEACKSRWYHGHVQASLFHKGVIKYLSKYVFKSTQEGYPLTPFRLISKGIGECFLKYIDLDGIIRDCWRVPQGILPRYYRDKLLPVYGASNEIERERNRRIRKEVFNRIQDNIEDQEFSVLKSLDNDIEAYIKKQQYLLRVQKRAVERQQKLKFG